MLHHLCASEGIREKGSERRDQREGIRESRVVIIETMRDRCVFVCSRGGVLSAIRYLYACDRQQHGVSRSSPSMKEQGDKEFSSK
jgi:hypothetical protein